MKGKKNKKNNVEDKNSKSEKKQTTEKDREGSMDQFLLEIEEYAKKLKDDENHEEDKDTTESYDSEQEAEFDNLHQEIDKFKEQVQHLNEIINSKDKVIESLKYSSEKDKTEEITKKVLCRYWNGGFCSEGDHCHYIHHEKDCRTYIKTGNCKDKKCQGRHRKFC